MYRVLRKIICRGKRADDFPLASFLQAPGGREERETQSAMP